MKIRFRSVAAFLVLAITACGPSVPSVPLQVEKSLKATFASVSNVVEYAPEQVAFTDPTARRFHTGDFSTGAVDTVGAAVDSMPANAPPLLYKLPGWVALLAGDTIAVVDFGALRTTLWTPAGFARTLVVPPVGGNTPVLLYDTLGHGYKVDFRSVAGGAEPGTLVRNDSMPVLRLALDGTTADTVARLSLPEFGDASFGPEVQSVARIFGPTDIFGVLPDGTIWVARARTMSVDWRAPDGKWTRGTPTTWSKVRVTDTDKQRVMDRLKARGLPQNVEVKFPFAETKPSFETALGRSTGEVWLQYSRANDTDPAIYAVINREGKMIRKVTAPDSVALTSLSATHGYGAMRNGDSRKLVRVVIP